LFYLTTIYVVNKDFHTWTLYQMQQKFCESRLIHTLCYSFAKNLTQQSNLKTIRKIILVVHYRICRYSLTYEAISDWICNCCQRLHNFFFNSCQSVIK